MAMCKERGDVVRNVRSLDVDQGVYRFNRGHRVAVSKLLSSRGTAWAGDVSAINMFMMAAAVTSVVPIKSMSQS